MLFPPFCPHKDCLFHYNPPEAAAWWTLWGTYLTSAHGRVRRFKCSNCNRTFSTQTFSTHYYSKKIISFETLELLISQGMCVRACSRNLSCSPDTVLNRLDRLSRQAVALHSRLRPLASPREPLCFDGFVSFDRSQYYPNDIGVSITSYSRYVLALSHATTRRAGRCTEGQRRRKELLYKGNVFERKAVERSITEHLDIISLERAPESRYPLIITTDEKPDYRRAICSHRMFLSQSEDRRIAHRRICSRLPRTASNPLFASNYYDRELRKDLSQHRRETTCFSRNPSFAMVRMYVHMVYHNYRKRYRENQRSSDERTSAEVAGVPKEEIERQRKLMYSQRAFLSRLNLKAADFKIWVKEVWDPVAGGLKRAYLPEFANA